MVAGDIGDTGGDHIDRDRSLLIRVWRHREGVVSSADCREGALGAIGHRDLAGIEAGDRFTEAEAEDGSTVGHAGSVVGDGQGGGDGVERQGDRRRRRGLVTHRVGDTGGAHINRDRALRTRSRGDHEGVNTATAAEGSLAAIGNHHLAGIETGDRFAEGEREGDRSAGHTGNVVVADGEGGSEDINKRLNNLRRRYCLGAQDIGDTAGVHIDCDIPLRDRIRYDHQRVDAPIANAIECSLGSIHHRYLAGIETGDRLAEGEGEGHQAGGHTGNVVGDGEG